MLIKKKENGNKLKKNKFNRIVICMLVSLRKADAYGRNIMSLLVFVEMI
jgi:hypothetical protein